MHRHLFIFLLTLTILGAVCSEDVEAKPFRHEIFTSIDFNQSVGDVKSDDSEKKLTRTEILANLSYGFLVTPVVEPFIEVNLHTTDEVIGEFEVSSSQIGYGLGVLFNFGGKGDVKTIKDENANTNDKDEDQPKKKKRKSRRFKSHWLPYGGFVIDATTVTLESGSSNKGKTNDNDITTKLILGVRYMLFKNVAINNWLRVSYNTMTTTAEETTKEEGVRNELNIEIRLFGISLMF